jgi:glycosyltransferase involved in cell wall biosynthesis
MVGAQVTAGAPEVQVAERTAQVPVSVLVPSFRRKHYLERALASVAAQKGLRPLEVVVVDDGSADGTAELARELGAVVIEKKHNEGLCRARADALEAARGEWVAFLDDDDEWLPDHLATLWARRGGHVIVATTSISFGGHLRRLHGAATDRPEVVRSPARLLFPENSFTTSAVMVRRDVLSACGGFDRDLAYLEDVDAWVRVLEHGSGLLVPEVTCLYRHHEGQVSRHRPEMQAATAYVMDKYEQRAWWSQRRRRDVEVVGHWDDFQAARGAGNWAEAVSQAWWLGRAPERLAVLARLLSFRRNVRRRSEALTAAIDAAEAATGAAPQL